MISYEKEIQNKVMKKVAKNLIRLEVPLEKIKIATNLPEDVIKELQKEITE
jgi:hypothetical protein